MIELGKIQPQAETANRNIVTRDAMQHFVLCTRVTVAQLVELVGCYYSGGLVVGTLGSFSPAEMSLKQTLNTKLPCVIVYGKNVLWFASK